MWEDFHESDRTADWTPIALRGGVARLRVPSGWNRLSRDDGGLAFQSPDPHPLDLLVSVTTYRNPYGVSTEEAIQYLDRENVLPHGISPSEEEDGKRRWIAYVVSQPPDRQVYVWKVANFRPPDHVRVVTVQLHVPESPAAVPELEDLVDRLGEVAARIEFSAAPVSEPTQRVTMRNVGHGDLVRFRLPWDWTSEPDGQLTVFHPDVSGAGSLRVAVQAFPHVDYAENEDEADADRAAQRVLWQTAQQFADGPDGRIGEGSVEWLPDGEVMARFITTEVEDGEVLRLHLWLRGSASDGQTTLALFSYVATQTCADSPDEQARLDMLENEIRAAIIGLGAEES